MANGIESVLVFAVVLLAVSVLLHAWVTWKTAATRNKHYLYSELVRHNAALEGVLDSEDGRIELARMIVNETNLQSFIIKVEDAMLQADDKRAAATAEAKKLGKLDRLKKLGGPVVKAVFEKVNGYVAGKLGGRKSG